MVYFGRLGSTFYFFYLFISLKTLLEKKGGGDGRKGEKKQMEIHLNQTSQPITHTGYKTGTQTQTRRFDYDDDDYKTIVLTERKMKKNALLLAASS